MNEKIMEEFEALIKRERPAYRAEHDDLRNVICWLTGGNRGGVFCMPDWMLVKPEVKL